MVAGIVNRAVQEGDTDRGDSMRRVNYYYGCWKKSKVKDAFYQSGLILGETLYDTSGRSDLLCQGCFWRGLDWHSFENDSN